MLPWYVSLWANPISSSPSNSNTRLHTSLGSNKLEQFVAHHLLIRRKRGALVVRTPPAPLLRAIAP